MRFEETTVFQASPPTVWAVLSDWERQASWMPDVAWVRRLGPEREIGARLAVRTKVFGVPLATDLLRVSVWDPPRRLAIDHQGLVTGSGEWTLQVQPDGRTHFTWVEELRMPPPVLGDLALWLYSPWQRWMLRRSLRNLGGLLEAEPVNGRD